MHPLDRKNAGLQEKLPLKIIQFGEGNFLRAFVGYAVQKLNEQASFNGGIAVVQPIKKGMVHTLKHQEGLYTLFLNGLKNGVETKQKELISAVVTAVNPYTNVADYYSLAEEEQLEFIISNTTEAGIAFVHTDRLNMEPPASFPAKLTQFLYRRFQFFNGDRSKGVAIIPCELINYNADTLKEIVLQYTEEWKLNEDFKLWLEQANSWHNTLVDRIVPGYPKDDEATYQQQLPYKDQLMVTAEQFFLWVIEGDKTLAKKLPFHQTDVDVKMVTDLQPYRTRKVRILNGAHTIMVPFSLLFGNTTVKETVDHRFTGTFVKKAIFEEIIETLPMEREALLQFSEEVLDRFRNPFIKHQLASIALNSIAKFKVRVLPSLLAYQEKKAKLPLHITYAFACLLQFYKGDFKGKKVPVQDSEEVVEFIANQWKNASTTALVTTVLGNIDFWEKDLTAVSNLPDAIVVALEQIDKHGIEEGFYQFKTLSKL